MTHIFYNKLQIEYKQIFHDSKLKDQLKIQILKVKLKTKFNFEIINLK